VNRKNYLIVLFIFFISSASAQYYDDAGMWNTINIEKRLKNNLSVFLTEEFRLRENFSQINLFYTEIGMEYRPYSFLKVAFSYRSIEKHLIDDSYSFRHRLMLDVTLRKKIKDWTLSYRHRLQAEERNIYSSEDGQNPEWYSRNKITVKYDLHKKVTPYVSCELRYQISDPRNIESDQTWHRARYAAGLDYELNKKSTIGAYYLIQHEWNVSIPENLYIVGLEYTLVL
jgi:hypothetical protein